MNARRFWAHDAGRFEVVLFALAHDDGSPWWANWCAHQPPRARERAGAGYECRLAALCSAPG